jgi:alkylhydroperoxidase family enzyme
MTADEMNVPNLDAPFLPPIESPEDEGLKQTYRYMHEQFGKVITPIKVHSARLPPEFLDWATKINELDRMLQLPAQTAMLIRGQVARLNVCLFCIDAERYAAMQIYKNEAKFDALDSYKKSSLFTDAERAALDYATELTKEKKVNAATFARLSRYYSEREICEIVYLIASEHVYNMTNIGLNIHSDMLCKVPQK